MRTQQQCCGQTAETLRRGFDIKHRAVLFLCQQINEPIRALANIADALEIHKRTCLR
jgi:hypothetical protein